jgi:hypothetical protein
VPTIPRCGRAGWSSWSIAAPWEPPRSSPPCCARRRRPSWWASGPSEAFYTGPDKKPLNEALKPDLLVDDRSRTYLEKDAPLGELILRRGVRRLLGEEPETEAKAA